MVLKKDQERIKLLLKDTITLLCKNGLTFKNEFSIEATIGITLDQDEVLLVSIHEIIQSELRAAKNAALQLEAENGQFAGNSEDQSGSTSPASTGKHHRKRRRSKVTVQEAEYDGHDSYDEEGSLDSESQHPPVKKSGRIDIKNESDDANNAEDLVFVKQEVEAGDWPTITSQGQGRLNEHEADQDSYTTYSSSMQQENLDFLQGASLEPVSAHVGHTALNRSQKTLAPSAVDMTPGPSNSQMRTDIMREEYHTSGSYLWPTNSTDPSRRADVEGDLYPEDISQFLVSGAPSRSRKKSILKECSICKSQFRSLYGYTTHMKVHQGNHPYKCVHCGKGMSSKTNFDEHMRHHTGDLLRCDQCNRTFITSRAYKIHVMGCKN